MAVMNSASFYTQSFGNLQIAGAGFLILLAILISRFFKLNLGRDILVSSMRTTLQLIFVGYVLRWLLNANSWGANLLTLLVMTLVAAQAVHSRLKEKNWRVYGLAFMALFLSVWPLGLLSVEIFFGGEAFQQSLFFIPYIGVLMGNALSAISLSFVGLERLRRENLLEIETGRALGATSFEACHRLYSEILRNALTPILNGMTVVGIVSLPGVMAGQLIGGVDPLVAARFQILVMFLIVFTALVGSLAAVFLNHRWLMPAWILQNTPALFFDFPAGTKVLLQGPSGVGKSRLLKSLVGLDETSILQKLEYKNIPAPEPISDRHVMYVPQKSFFTPGTVLENLQRPFEYKKYSTQRFHREDIEYQLVRLGMKSDILNKNAMTLSGGEAQIIHLLRSLQLQPQVLLLDEVTSALDTDRARLVETFVNDWVRNPKVSRSLIFISHSKTPASEFPSQRLVLEEAKVTRLEINIH